MRFDVFVLIDWSLYAEMLRDLTNVEAREISLELVQVARIYVSFICISGDFSKTARC